MKKALSEMNFADGEMLLIDKPLGWTSFAVVAQLKKWTKAKIGHAGTLDPLASGLMILCTGKYTKKLTALIGLPKAYEGIIHLGASTETYDLESLPTSQLDVSHIEVNTIENALINFRGNIEQFPPIHSAIKQDGKPIYELARQGKEVVVKSRQLNISAFDILAYHAPELHFYIACSSGTYIRSLANDLGNSLGCGAYLQSLRRTEIGEHNISNSYTIHEMADYFGSKMNARIILPAHDRAR
jgi:tRNA pseudouridine55 synthase